MRPELLEIGDIIRVRLNDNPGQTLTGAVVDFHWLTREDGSKGPLNAVYVMAFDGSGPPRLRRLGYPLDEGESLGDWWFLRLARADSETAKRARERGTWTESPIAFTNHAPRPRPDQSKEHSMPDPDSPVFMAPFTASPMKQRTCVCVGCGAERSADFCISEYPFRFLPKKWSVDGHTGALRCPTCTKKSAEIGEPILEWWFTHAAFYGSDGIVTFDLTTNNGDHSMSNDDTKNPAARRRRPASVAEEEPTFKDKAKAAGAGLAGAAALGAKLAAVNKTGDGIMRIAKRFAADNDMIAGMLETDEGREAVKGIIAGLLYFGGAFELFPARLNGPLRRAGGLQVSASTFVILDKYGDAVLDELEGLAEIGMALGDDGASDPLQLVAGGDEDSYERAQRKAREAVGGKK